jgi:hypothetical protein
LQVNIISEAFTDAQKVGSGLIVFDSIERIVEMIQAGPQKIQFSHRILHVITTLLTATYAAGSRVMVLTTTSASREIREILGIDSLFTTQIDLPLLGVDGAQTVLAARKVLRIGGGVMALPPRLQVTVRDILSVADAARFEVERAASNDAAGDGADTGGDGNGSLAPVLLSQPHFDELLELVVPKPTNVSYHHHHTRYDPDEEVGVQGRFEQI